MAVTSSSERVKQHGPAWLSNILGLILLILTIMYATRSYSMTAVRSVRSSSANTILVLRVLTEITSILLTINLALTLENIKWRLVTRIKGQKLPDFLSLVPGTSAVGLVQLVLSKGSAWASWRFWSLGRLFLLALLPVLNVIIFSNIHTQENYHVETTMTGPYNGQMGDFNASKAANYASMIDSFIGPGFADFLSDTRRIIDITPNSKDKVPCSSGFSKTSTQTCDQTFFMPGIVVDLDLLRNAAVPQADLFVMHNSPGYMLNFTTSNDPAFFDAKEDCRAYGEKVAAFEICAKGERGLLEMRLNACVNMESLQSSDCLVNRKWPGPPGKTIKAQISVRNATVGFSRLNTTIQTLQLAESWTPLNISGADLLTSFDGFFGKPKSTAAGDFFGLIESITGSAKVKYAPIFIVSSIAFVRASYGESVIVARNTNSLQALLAISLHYCSGVFGIAMPSAETVPASGGYNLTAVLEESFSNFPEATYSLASTRYDLVVGRTTIWIYAALGGLFLLINLVVLCICTFVDSEQKRPVTTSFADIDHRGLRIDVPESAGWRGPRWNNVGRVGLNTYNDDDDGE